jgi:hypothetical protein
MKYKEPLFRNRKAALIFEEIKEFTTITPLNHQFFFNIK